MKRIALIAAAAIATTSANAADLYRNGGLKDGGIAPIIAPVATWTGFYLGVNGGGAWATLDSSISYAEENYWSATLNHTNAATGFLGGGQVGYNFQTGSNFLIGVEADFGWLGVDQTRNLIEANFVGNNIALGTKIESGFLADVTGRLGFTSGPALFYVKGGWAYFDGTIGTSGIDALNITGAQDVSVTGHNGWIAGGGIEYLWTPTWSTKLEFEHFDFGCTTFSPVPENTKFDIGNKFTMDTVKVGLNYHWPVGGSPLK